MTKLTYQEKEVLKQLSWVKREGKILNDSDV